MFDSATMIWLVPAAPLTAAILCGLLRAIGVRGWGVALPSVLGIGFACYCALTLLTRVGSENPVLETAEVTWFAAGQIDVSLRLAVDSLTAVMLTVITFVGSWIALFSIGYMRDHHGQLDTGYARFFALMSLFVFSMTGLVLATNFLVLFACWEGVGLCSYLLIGHWFAKPSAAAAARKAFLVTRLGDIGLILGVFLLWVTFDHTLDFNTLFAQLEDTPPEGVLTAASLLLFCGAVGKSAQLPLYTWLPDAMEGPTPVSALIHAATMVTAGVYLMARMTPLLVLAPFAQHTVAIIGAATALIASFIALTQFDLKRVLAYSTVSQLGYMFMALGAGIGSLAEAGVVAALFHLFTHAFFKALLFLSAGSVMHAMGDVIDMRRFSGLRKLMPVTHIGFLCGALALAAIPPFSGFWSKEAIFGVVEAASKKDQGGGIYLSVLLVGVFAAGMTAVYTFRAYFKTFWGEQRVPDEAGEHPHESPAIMTIPLLILAVGAVFAGLVLEPVLHIFGPFVGLSPLFTQTEMLIDTQMVETHGSVVLMLASIAAAVGGLVIAYIMFGRPSELPDRISHSFHRLYAFSADQLYLDDLYSIMIVGPLRTIATLCGLIDMAVDGLGRLISSIPGAMGRLLQPIQIGLVQFYALAMAMGLIVFLGFLVFRGN